MIDERDHCPYLGFAEELLTLVDHPAEILAAMLRMRFRNELLPESYVDLNRKTRRENPDKKGHARIRISAGRDDGLTVPQLLEMIFDRTRIKGSRLGRIDLKNDCTYLNANPEDAKRILDSFHGMTPEFVLVPEEEGLPNFEAIPKRGRKFSRHRDHASGEKRPSRSFRDGFLENLHRELSGEERHHLEPHTPDRKKFRSKSGGEFSFRRSGRRKDK